MTRRPPPDDDGPIDSDLERFGGVTQSCSSCGTALYDDADICWKCGHAQGAPATKQIPTWILITTSVVLAAFLMGLLLRMIR